MSEEAATPKTCRRCGFDMTAKQIDPSITIWTCPFGHRVTEWGTRPSATFPSNLERKARNAL